MPLKKIIFLLYVISFFTYGCKKDNNGDSTSAGTVTDVDGTSIENDINAWFRGVGYNLAGVSRVGLNKVLGLSVRCVK
jgi:hypothetical protein